MVPLDRRMPVRMSGLHIDFVGWCVGFPNLPDKARRSQIKRLNHKCRECQVVITEESRGERVQDRFKPIVFGSYSGPKKTFGLQLDSSVHVLWWEGYGKCLKSFGGPGRVRTVDLFHAMEARSQLRHRPTKADYCDFNTANRAATSFYPWRLTMTV